jgi:DNA-binding NarL/FixJ family response regulator
MISVLIADDEAMIRTGLRLILETEEGIVVVAEAADGAAAVELARHHRPEVALVDLRMPKMDGIAATQRICELPGAPTNVVVLTTFDLDENVYAALHAGAAGYLLKSSPPERLVEAIRLAAAGEALLEPSITRRVISDIVARGERHRAGPELDRLTPRERDVLGLLSTGLSNAEIAQRLLMGEATVKTHVTRILHKLGLRNRVQAVAYAYRTGFAE